MKRAASRLRLVFVGAILSIALVLAVFWRQAQRWPDLQRLDRIVEVTQELADSYHQRQVRAANGSYYRDQSAINEIAKDEWPHELVRNLEPQRPMHVRVYEDSVHVWLAASRGEGWGFRVDLKGHESSDESDLPSTGDRRVHWFVMSRED